MPANVASAPHLRRTGNVLTLASVAAILVATLVPASGHSMAAHFCLVCGPLGGVDAVLNVLLFAPLGAGLALSGISWRRAVLTAFALSITVEMAQLLFIPGRDATLGDVVTNTLGATLGVALVGGHRVWLTPSRRAAALLALVWSSIWLTIQLISSFAFAISIPSSTFYGQFARRLGNFDVFEGRVLGANVGTMAITDAQVGDAETLRRGLLARAEVSAIAVPAHPTSGIAPILRLADGDQREIVLLAQNQREFLFGIRTGAATLRLRAPFFGLATVFPGEAERAEGNVADTVRLTGRYLPDHVVLSARTRTGFSRRAIPFSTAFGWTLILPAQWFVEDTLAERILGFMWVALLVLPIGYWSGHANRSSGGTTVPGHHGLLWPAALVILACGLAVAPVLFGLSSSPPRDWLAALAGVAIGTALAFSGRPGHAGRGES